MEFEIRFPHSERIEAVTDSLEIATDHDGSAPTPMMLFLASLGTCAGLYVLRFLRQRGLSTTGLRLVQRTEVDPSTRLIRQVELEITLPADFPEKYRDAVVRAAGLCTVKRHLEHPPSFQIQTRLASS